MDETTTGSPPAAWPAELLAWLAAARLEIAAHGNDRGLCAVCGSAFPCPRAEMAAFALGAL